MNDFEKSLSRYFNREQLTKIRAVKIGIAGAGGLGSNCANALVRSGFRNFKLVDFDIVDFSNLNRQFYFLKQAGENKVNALKDNLKRINPSVNIEINQQMLNADNIRDFFTECDVIVEAFDKAEYKKLIVESYINSEKLLVSASGIAGWGNSDRIRVHRIKDNFYLIGDRITGIDSDNPPLAPCVFIAAAKQADIVLSYVLGTIQKGNHNETSG